MRYTGCSFYKVICEMNLLPYRVHEFISLSNNKADYYLINAGIEIDRYYFSKMVFKKLLNESYIVFYKTIPEKGHIINVYKDAFR